MIRRAARTTAPLKTRTFTTEIIGGKGVGCAERYGFTQTKNGIKSSYSAVTETPTVTLAGVQLAQYLDNRGVALFVDEAGAFYYWNKTDYPNAPKQDTLAAGKAFVVPCYNNSYDAYAVFCGNYTCVTEGKLSTKTKLTTPFYCGTYHSGRVFARSVKNPYEIHWSGNRVSDWSQQISRSGYVRIDPRGGEVYNIAEFGGKVVLVRKYGLSVISAQGDPRNFRFEATGEKILPEVIPDTAVICNGKLWFYTELGLYGYDGNSVFHRELEFLGKKYAVKRAMAYKGRYIYFESECDGDELILEYDCEEDALTPFGKGCRMPFENSDGLYVFRGNAVCKLSKSATDATRKWKSETVICGTDADKTLKYLNAVGDGNIFVTVNCDGRERVMRGFGKFSVNMRGREFTFTVNGTGSLKTLTADWEANYGI